MEHPHDWQQRGLDAMLNLLMPTPTFEAEAYMLFPKGCTCRNETHYCDYCSVLLYGPEYAIATSPLEVA